jgi:hypothetical protein
MRKRVTRPSLSDHSLTDLTRRGLLSACAAGLPYSRVFAQSPDAELVEVKTAYGRVRGARIAAEGGILSHVYTGSCAI